LSVIIRDDIKEKIIIINKEFEKMKTISDSPEFNSLKKTDKKIFKLLSIELSKLKFIYSELSNKSDNDILNLLSLKELKDIENIFNNLVSFLREFDFIESK